MDKVLAQHRVMPDDLAAYADDVGPALLGNLYDASAAQIEALDRIVQRWKKETAVGDWSRLHVVVLGPGRPREGNPAYDYFVRLLGQDTVGTRVLAAENIRDPEAGLDLLATTIADRALALTFFADATKAQRGLITDGARRQLDHLFGTKHD
jgi:hypothetical protein